MSRFLGFAQSGPLLTPEILSTKEGLPQSFVPGIVQDKQGFIWIATRDGLCRYDGRHLKVFQPTTDGKPGISSLGINKLLIDSKGKMWIFSDKQTIDIMDPVKEDFINLSKLSIFKKIKNPYPISATCVDRHGKLWLNFESKKSELYCISADFSNEKQYNAPPFFTLQEDKYGTLWGLTEDSLYQKPSAGSRFLNVRLPYKNFIGGMVLATGEIFMVTKTGVAIFNRHSIHNQFVRFPKLDLPLVYLWDSKIAAAANGDIYFTNQNYLLRFSKNKEITIVAQLPKENRYRSLFIDCSNVLWAGTDTEGIKKYNIQPSGFSVAHYQSNFFGNLFQLELGIPVSPSLANTANPLPPYYFRYTYDKAGDLWFNTGNERGYRMNMQTHSITPVTLPMIPHKLPINETIVALGTDPEGNIWGVSDSTAMWFGQGKWHHFPFFKRARGQPKANEIEGEVLQIVVDQENLWLATASAGLYQINRQTGRVRNYRFNARDPTTLSSNQLFCLFQDTADANILWIGTFGSGLCRLDKRTGVCRRFSTKDGLPNNVVYSAIPDKQGSLWIGTNKGLCRMDRRTFQTNTFTVEDGLLENEFNRFHFLQLPNDRIIMGGPVGTVSFYPQQIHRDTHEPVTQISAIYINNKPLLPGPLTDSLPVQSIYQLKLPYNQNFVSVEFAAMQYNSLTKVHYRYQLEGLDAGWVITDQPIAQYTGLRPGHYRLRMNATNTSGVWSNHIRELLFIINPPWWESLWAILLYILLIIAVAYIFIRSYLNYQEAQQLKNVDAVKARFFTNITHEFRTPLTLILSPAERLKVRLPKVEDRLQVELIEQNANKLLGLINQLLDLAKADGNMLQLNENQGELGSYLEQLVRHFETEATDQQVTLRFVADTLPYQYWFDHEKLDRIVSNLLANALKFTPKGGHITVSLKLIYTETAMGVTEPQPNPKTWFRLVIADDGIGISETVLQHIFDRFYHAEKNRGPRYGGAGIGLALVKELVELQSGAIQVKSKEQAGTTFTIDLPYRQASVRSEQIVTLFSSPVVSTEPKPDELEEDDRVQDANDSPVILLVEDNESMGMFLANSLPAYYEIHRAQNGLEGLERAFDLIPDLIISDVMMPLMDGYTLCANLKNDDRTSHIPIILLTAKSTVADRLEGLSLGADDYITKPFSLKELQLRMRNLLDRQKQLQQWFQTRLSSPTPLPADLAEMTPMQQDPLLEKLVTIIEQHLDDASFGVEELIDQSGFSRMNLHRKLKALTGESAGEFIRTYRLKRAAQFLREGRPVSETAYLVGFEDPSYFARSFRKVYQVSPSSFAKENK